MSRGFWPQKVGAMMMFVVGCELSLWIELLHFRQD
jgi:hypothetical protein